MKLVKQSWEWVQAPVLPLKIIELAGRTCYQSGNRMTETSAERFAGMLIKQGHLSVVEHVAATVKFITSRGVTHELIRHRLASYSQESTRYCNYGGSEIKFIEPVWWESASKIQQNLFLRALQECETAYNDLLRHGWRPEQAREVLPSALKTEIIVTANLREWQHIFGLRCSARTHPQIRELMRACLKGFAESIPVIFDGISKCDW